MVAKFLSYLFHPIFAPLYSVFILFQLPIYLNYKMPTSFIQFVYAVVGINLIITPLLISLYFKRKGYIQSLEMPDVKDRVLPYLVSSLFYTFTFFLFQSINFPDIYLAVFKAATAVVIALLIFAHLNFKVSAHLAGLGGICGMLFTLSVVLRIELSSLLIVSILVAGLVGSSRFYLKAHSFRELSSGFSLGFIAQVFFLGF